MVLLAGFPEVGLGALVVLMVLGCLVTYLVMRHTLLRELTGLRAEMGRLKSAPQAAASTVTLCEAEPKALAMAAGAGTGGAQNVVTAAVPVVAKPTEPTVLTEPAEEPSEEVLLLIAAAVCAFMGKRARVRHARLLQPNDTSAWAQQGRVFVQASHNLGLSHHG